MYVCVLIWACHPDFNDGEDNNTKSTSCIKEKGTLAIRQRCISSSSSSSGTHQRILHGIINIGTPLSPSFHLATPPGSQVNKILKGNLVRVCTKWAFFAGILLLFFSCHWFSLVLSASVHPSGSRVHYGASTDPGRVLPHALSVQNNEIWQEIPGVASAQVESTRPMPELHLFCFCTAAACCIDRSGPQSLGSHGATAALGAFPFVSTMKGAAACV